MHFKTDTAIVSTKGKRKSRKRKKKVSDGSGILYILVFHLKCGTEVYKIGITTRNVEDRVVEILHDFFIKYRYFPAVDVRRFTRFEDVLDKEKEMHREFKEYQHTFEKSFSGFTECFSGIPLDNIVDYYDSNYKN